MRLAVGLLVGILGVSVLMAKSVRLGEAPLDRPGAIAILVAAVGWSTGTILTRKLSLPASKAMSAAAQMLLGGLQLFVLAAVSGEFAGFHPGSVSATAWFALIYLIVFGSLIGFTAYVWLLHYESPTMVGTYAYVNPVVAVAVGHFVGGESIGPRTILGTLLVLASVLMITLRSSQSQKAMAAVSQNRGRRSRSFGSRLGFKRRTSKATARCARFQLALRAAAKPTRTPRSALLRPLLPA